MTHSLTHSVCDNLKARDASASKEHQDYQNYQDDQDYHCLLENLQQNGKRFFSSSMDFYMGIFYLIVGNCLFDFSPLYIVKCFLKAE